MIFTPRMAVAHGARLGQSQELHSDLPCGWQKAKHLGPSSAALPATSAGKWIGNGTAGTPTGTLIQNASDAGWGLTLCTTTPA